MPSLQNRNDISYDESKLKELEERERMLAMLATDEPLSESDIGIREIIDKLEIGDSSDNVRFNVFGTAINIGPKAGEHTRAAACLVNSIVAFLYEFCPTDDPEIESIKICITASVYKSGESTNTLERLYFDVIKAYQKKSTRFLKIYLKIPKAERIKATEQIIRLNPELFENQPQ